MNPPTNSESICQIAAPPDEPERKPYETPKLTDFGSLVEITRGAIGAGGDLGIYS